MKITEKMSLSEIQKCEFEILSFIDDFCSKHHIKYSLAAGTLIGAVRHKGFIPWDDDIDIVMTRENYDLFRSEMKKVSPESRYQLCCYDGFITNPYSAYTKVVDMKTAGVEPYKRDNTNTKVWVDVFPIDFLPEGTEQIVSLEKRFMRNFYCLQAKSNVCNSLLKKAYKLLVTFRNPFKVSAAVDEYGKVAKRSDKCFNLTFMTRNRIGLFWESSWFDSYTKLEFCGRSFPCIAAYDSFLRECYGDYMVLPPIEKRHSHSLDAYWVE